MCSGNEIGPFRAIEESTLAHLTPAEKRGDIYAWYSLIGTAGAAAGMVVTGWSIHYMRETLGWEQLVVYRAVFWGYAIVGVVKLLLTLGLSKECEAEKKRPAPTADTETAPLLGDDAQVQKKKKSIFRSLLPEISSESKLIVTNLCLLFALDSFASGLASL
jgi:MFS family permease